MLKSRSCLKFISHLHGKWISAKSKRPYALVGSFDVSRFTCKPLSVLLAKWRSSICPDRYQPESCSTPGAFCGTSRPNAPAWPCSRWGLPGREHHCPRRWSLTPPFHPRRACAWHCTSLLRFPSGCPAWPLASTAPCGERTFLPPDQQGSDHPANLDTRSLYAPCPPANRLRPLNASLAATQRLTRSGQSAVAACL